LAGFRGAKKIKNIFLRGIVAVFGSEDRMRKILKVQANIVRLRDLNVENYGLLECKEENPSL